MTIDFHPEAETELLDAIDYYESREPGLGRDFSHEVFAAIEKILAYPNTWPILIGEIRRCLTNRFPFGILYSVDDERVLILAVMHLHREPGYWAGRR